MEEAKTQQDKLSHDIRLDAEAEAKKITEEASRFSQERKESYERQIGEIRAGAKKTAAQQVKAVEKTLQASLTVALKRITLKNRDLLFKQILARVHEKLGRLVREKNYRQILLVWIVEAAVGLDSPRVRINASTEELELIDSKLITEAKAKIKALTKKDVEIVKTDAPALALQGVLVTAADGKTAFNNQVATRISRYQRGIRKIIYSRLLGDGGE
jgi:vacuolar-type H+-ATPase subunit E/Vma4